MRPGKDTTWSMPFLGGLAKPILGNPNPWCMPKVLIRVSALSGSQSLFGPGWNPYQNQLSKPLVVAETATARDKDIADTHSQTDREGIAQHASQTVTQIEGQAWHS